MVALCADVEEAELEGEIVVVDDAVHRVVVVDVELSRLPRVKSRTGSRGHSRRRHEDAGTMGSHHG
jgi:hypothetical protein